MVRRARQSPAKGDMIVALLVKQDFVLMTASNRAA
jgi:hypothetical protein